MILGHGTGTNVHRPAPRYLKSSYRWEGICLSETFSELTPSLSVLSALPLTEKHLWWYPLEAPKDLLWGWWGGQPTTQTVNLINEGLLGWE
jgi:hypothetical protein